MHYPASTPAPKHVREVIDIFTAAEPAISSHANGLSSNAVLLRVRPQLLEAHFEVEGAPEKVTLPVLFGVDGRIEKRFNVDAFQRETGTVLEVEAGRAIINNAIYLDLVKACIIPEAEYLIIAVPLRYSNSAVFESTRMMLDMIYASARLPLPLKGVTAVGY